MKLNADYREFKEVDDIINDMTTTLASWQESRIAEVINNEHLSSYVNDWYHAYELTKEEEEMVVDMVTDFFAED